MQSTTTSKKPQAPPKQIHGKVRTSFPPDSLYLCALRGVFIFYPHSYPRGATLTIL